MFLGIDVSRAYDVDEEAESAGGVTEALRQGIHLTQELCTFLEAADEGEVGGGKDGAANEVP